MRALLSLLAAAAVASYPPRAAAQLAGPPVPGYVHSMWTTQHGLPQSVVHEVVETRDGYLWAGTGNGLARFDGLRFVIFDGQTTPELPSGWITALLESRDGTLWIGTDLGLARYSDGTFIREDLGVARGKRYVNSIQEDPAGRLWVATGQRVLRREADRWRAIPIGDVHVNGLLADPEGTLWVGTETGLIEWRGRVRRTFTRADGLPGDAVWPLLADGSGDVWLRAGHELVRIDRRSGAREPVPDALAEAIVHTAFEAEDGRIWIGAHDTLFSLDDAGRLSALPINGSDRQEDVVAVSQDRAGHLWLGVSGGRGGLHRLGARRVSMLALEQGLPCDNAVSIAQGPDGTVWAGLLCSEEAGLVAIRDGRVTPYAGPGARIPRQVTSVLAPPEGGVWFGVYGPELYHLEEGRLTRYTTADSGLTGRAVLALHRDDAGAIWIGTKGGGLHRFHEGRWTTLTTRDGLVHDDVRCITAGRDGALWVGTNGGLSRYADGRFTNYTRDGGLPFGTVRSLHVDGDGTVWIGANGGGLARLKDGEITRFGTRDGLLDKTVHRILEDDRGDLWLSGDRGIRRVSRDELNALADGRSTRLSVDIFDERDGMKNAEANGMAQPSGWRMRDGSLWFPTQGGIVRIDPEAAARNASAPPVAIESVLVGGVELDPRGSIEVPPGDRELEIRYTAPAFTRPEQVQFRYRLQGYDERWVEAGPRRVAHYANLAPGAYRFEVAARSASGVWSDERATLALDLRPHLHERPSVRLGAVLLLVAAAAMAVRRRVARHRRRAEELETQVSARTAELRRQRQDLSDTNLRLGEANEQLRGAKREVEASHSHLLSVLDQLRVGVLVVDLDERVLYVSSATRRLIAGSDGDGVVGKPLDEILPVPATALTEVRTRLRDPRSGVRTTIKLEPPSGRPCWTEIETCIDPRDDRHRILYLYDVTETYELNRPHGSNGDGAMGRLVGTSSAIRRVRGQIDTVCGVDATVLIEGETGTGKELVARAIHEASDRRRRSFVAINCAGLTESLLASQLFGHKRGAFTGAVSDHVGLFEAAQGGTLLLDEIGDMPPAMQTHLLRVLQEREIIRVGDTRPRSIDVRVLASTHRNLEEEVEEGRFREDLLYRIRVARILLPPLRQRPEDVPQLAATFLSAFAAAHDKAPESIGREAMERLKRHDWPGNVRELKAVIEWAVIHTDGPVVKLADLPPELATDGLSVPPAPRPGPVRDADLRALVDALKRTGGNRTAAARLLGIGRTTLYRRLAALERLNADGGAGSDLGVGTG